MFNFLNQGILGFILFLNNFFNDFGLTIIFFTLVLKLILLPLDFLVFLEEEKLKRLRPKIKEILNKYKNDIQTQATALTEIYQKENYNPLKTILIQFLPLPLILAIFFALGSLTEKNLDLTFLGLIDLKEKNIFLVLVVALLQFLSILNLPQDQRKLSFFLSGLIVFILIQFPAIFNLYWLVNILIALIERELFRFYQIKFLSKPIPENNT